MGSSDGWCSEWSGLTLGTGSRKDSKASYWLDPGVVSDTSTEGRSISLLMRHWLTVRVIILLVPLIPIKTRDRRGI
jgi:hypothetical protein